MASLVLRTFGGMAPSSRDTGLDPAVAEYAKNLNLRFADFRPLPQPASVATATPGNTLYRFETVDGFITSTGQVNYVRGPIPTDATERTYYTGDGAPKVTDTSGQVRQLGVPAPTAAPGVTVNATAQYSTDDSARDQAKKLAEIISAINANIEWRYDIGLTDTDLGTRFIVPTEPNPWSAALKIPGALSGGVFVPTNPAHANLMDDRMYFSVYNDGTTIYGRVDLDVRGAELYLKTGLSDALAAITDPSDSSGVKKLLAADQVSSIVSTLTEALKPADAVRDEAVARLKDAKDHLLALADSGSDAAAASPGAVSAFYAQSSVTSAITDAVNQAVSAIRDAMNTYNNA